MKKFTQTIGILAILFTGLNLQAQSESKNTPTVSNCGCPGELWNLSTAYKPWVSFPTPTNSKRLMHTSYNFNIPANASITGIQVNFAYTTLNVVANTLRDTICTLLINGSVAGSDHSPTTPFFGAAGNITYGGPTDTWGLSLSPADVNSPSFGFNFKMYCDVANTQLTFDNGATITVFYNTAAGISESQKSSQGIKVYYTNKQLKVESDVVEKTDIEIFNLTGKKILKSTHENTQKSAVDLSDLEKGVYLYSVKSASKSKVAKFIVD